MRFAANAVWLQLQALDCNLAFFLRTKATPELIEHRSLTSLRERLIKTGTRLVRHGRYAIFQMAEVAIPAVYSRTMSRTHPEHGQHPARATAAGKVRMTRPAAKANKRLGLPFGLLLPCRGVMQMGDAC
jgi:hypothetical protein